MAKKQTGPIQINLSDTTAKKEIKVLSNGCRTILQQIAPSAILYSSEDELKVGENYTRSFVINGYPASVYTNWLDDLYCYQGDLDVKISVHPTEDTLALIEITSKLAQYLAELQIEQENGKITHVTELEDKIRKLTEQRIKIERSLENMFQVATFSALYNPILKELNKASQKLIARLKGRKVGLMPLNLRHDEGFKSCSPYGVTLVDDYYRNMNTGSLATMFPFYNPEFSTPNGTFIGLNKYTSTAMFLDFFNKKFFANANMTVTGGSGSGKSYFLSLLGLRGSLEGIKHVYIDPEGEQKRITNAVGGVVYDLAPNANTRINPFDIDSEEEVDDDGEPTGRVFVDLKGKISELLSLLKVMLPNLLSNEVIVANVSDVLSKLYANFGISDDPNSIYEEKSFLDNVSGTYYHDKILKLMPRLSDFKNLLEQMAVLKKDKNLSDVAEALSIYCEGGIYDLFDCYSTVSLNTNNIPMITFDISGIEDNLLRPIAMTVVFTWVWNKFIKKDLKTKKRVIADEAWLLIEGEEALSLEKYGRRIRKYNGSLVCGSQNVREFSESKEGLAILSCSMFKVFLKQTPEDIAAIGDRFLLSDGEKSFLLRAMVGEALIKVGMESFIVDIMAYPEEDKMISKKYLKNN